MLFTDRSVKKKSRKRKKSKLLEATQSKKVKLESTPQIVPVVPPKSTEFWAWVTETTSSTPESSLTLLAEIAAKPADLGERATSTRSAAKPSSSYYAKLNAIKLKEEKVPSDTTKLEPGIHDRLNQG